MGEIPLPAFLFHSNQKYSMSFILNARHDAALPDVPVVAVDFETFYSTDYSVSDSSYWHYCNDARFDAYLVSIVGPGIRFVGNPKDFDWRLIDGLIWVSHNRAFDKAVYERLCETIPLGLTSTPIYWGDTAALSVFLRAPRALAGAMQALYQITRSKDIRNNTMKNKRWNEFQTEVQEKIKAYALTDAEDARQIWVDHAHKWPLEERRISDMLAERCQRGFQIDRDSLDDDIRFIGKVMFDAAAKVPWSSDGPILSHKWLGIECRKVGIEPPKSLAMTDEDCETWENTYGEQFPWVQAMRTWRRANTILKKLEAIRDRIRDDGRMEFSLLYHGAHTARTSGAGGFNMLNLPRSAFLIDASSNILARKEDIEAATSYHKKEKQYPAGMRGIDFRSKFVAAPGKKLVVGDLAQIEARVLRWLAGDHATLRLIDHNGLSPYEAHARRFMGFTGSNMKKEDPIGYQLAKARELSLGFGVGWFKFITMAKNYVGDEYFAKIFGAATRQHDREEFVMYINSLRSPSMKAEYNRRWKNADEFTRNTFVNSYLQVRDFRDKNPEIMALHKRLGSEMERSLGENYEIELPSGRSLHYFNVSRIDGSIQARVERGGNFTYYHGGLLSENITQAVARDVFVASQIRAEEAGFNILLDVYDEIVTEEPLTRDKDDLLRVMTARPDWAKSLPIGAEVEEMQAYRK